MYGVISFATRQRTREIGVRLALGATSASVVRLILRDGLAMTATGLLLGLAIAFPAAQILQSQLYATSAHDPQTFGLAAFLLLGVAALASYVPAARAAALDPTRALRQD
jgi:ABC-type antimicrobial peptide transport system permease subunit